MTGSVVSTITTALWIAIEVIQFAWLMYLRWRGRSDVSNRHIQRARTSFACA